MAEPDSEPKICEPGGRGMIFPFVESEQEMESIPRAIIYCLVLMYLFLGVNVVADKFMSSIEMITSSTKRIRVKGTKRFITVKKWNATVANITLMALGSSAPEILLSIVEMIRNRFTAGDLGPSTIVGSAAFNLFMIIGVCIVSIPSPETREIKEMGVFFVTAVFSLLAYLWLVCIVQVTSPDVIEIWEGAVTLALFPVLTLISYLSDVGCFSRKGQARAVVSDAGTVMNPVKPILDTKGIPIENDAGVFTFQSDYMEVMVGEESVEETIPVFRCNGTKGMVSCRYRTVACKAVANRDFCPTEGELIFDSGDSMKEFNVTLLRKEKWESDDFFQVRLEDCRGGSIFNPLDDGGEECCILTVQLINKNKDLQHTNSYKVRNFVDSHLNLDLCSLGWSKWKENVRDSLCQVSEEEEAPTAFAWVFHIICVPWKLMFALLCPPAEYCWGWVCFGFSLFWVGALTAIIIDFAELFGCVTTLKDAVTAITFVALGTSMPDLFASITAAAEDEYADASIVNVTGSNSVNVFLGIGIPWTMAAIYWHILGATPQWTADNQSFLQAHPKYADTGAFVVIGGDLAFGVCVFTVAAIIGLGIIYGRRLLYGGELGGPSAPKWASGGSMACLWLFYIALATWKCYNSSASFGRQIAVLLVGVYMVVGLMFLLGITSKLIDCAMLARGNVDSEADDVSEDTALVDHIIDPCVDTKIAKTLRALDQYEDHIPEAERPPSKTVDQAHQLAMRLQELDGISSVVDKVKAQETVPLVTDIAQNVEPLIARTDALPVAAASVGDDLGLSAHGDAELRRPNPPVAAADAPSATTEAAALPPAGVPVASAASALAMTAASAVTAAAPTPTAARSTVSTVPDNPGMHSEHAGAGVALGNDPRDRQATERPSVEAAESSAQDHRDSQTASNLEKQTAAVPAVTSAQAAGRLGDLANGPATASALPATSISGATAAEFVLRKPTSGLSEHNVQKVLPVPSLTITVPPGAPGNAIQVPLPMGGGSFVTVRVPSYAQVGQAMRIEIPRETMGSIATAPVKQAAAAASTASPSTATTAATSVEQTGVTTRAGNAEATAAPTSSSAAPSARELAAVSRQDTVAAATSSAVASQASAAVAASGPAGGFGASGVAASSIDSSHARTADTTSGAAPSSAASPVPAASRNEEATAHLQSKVRESFTAAAESGQLGVGLAKDPSQIEAPQVEWV